MNKLTIGKPLYSITDTGFVVIYNSKYNYADDEEIMAIILKYGKVVLDDDFNAPIPFIVNGVSMLICGKRFNHPLDNLPSSLRVLQIGAVCDTFYSEFNHSLKYLPHGLEDLRLFAVEKSNITLDLGYYLPSTLKYLYVSCESRDIDLNLLPDSIEEIYYNQTDIDEIVKLPANLKLFCGGSNYWKNREQLKQKFPELQVKSVGLDDYWLRYNKYYL